MRFIDPAAAHQAINTRFPNTQQDTESCLRWIATQLNLKAQGRLHDVAAVAIYEEHAQV